MDVLAVDFEMVNQSTGWLAYCMALVSFPSGNVQLVYDGACHRHPSEYHPRTAAFWDANPEAHRQLRVAGQGIEPAAAEAVLCQRVSYILRHWPHVYVVSDNPCLDIGLLNIILMKNGMDCISFRPTGIFRQPVCLWSYKLGRESVSRSNPIVAKSNPPSMLPTGSKHTPLHDCLVLIWKYFRYLTGSADDSSRQ